MVDLLGFLRIGKSYGIEAVCQLTVAVAFLLWLQTSSVIAAPITLRFEGVVGPPRQEAELPQEISPGNPVTGIFSIEPLDSPSDAFDLQVTQDVMFSLAIGSLELETTRLFVRVNNDLTSVDLPAPVDVLILQCLRGTSCGTNDVPGYPNTNWSFTWTLGGGNNILDGPDIPSTVETWNQFSRGSLLVTFLDVGANRGTGFQVITEEFQIVPEPTSALLNCVVLIALFGRSLCRRKLNF